MSNIELENLPDMSNAPDEDVLLDVRHLKKHFVVGTNFFGKPTKWLKAVDNVSFSLKKGKTLGIVGESGCGKTTMGRTILRLYDVTGGEVWFKGREVSQISDSEFDKLRPQMQMIFQDPYASLSPRLTVGEIIGEAAREHGIVPPSEYKEYIPQVQRCVRYLWIYKEPQRCKRPRLRCKDLGARPCKRSAKYSLPYQIENRDRKVKKEPSPYLHSQ